MKAGQTNEYFSRKFFAGTKLQNSYKIQSLHLKLRILFKRVFKTVFFKATCLNKRVLIKAFGLNSSFDYFFVNKYFQKS